jgi:catechol 2,3-dioxygenase-like lactoylglutathione lyase family enzyme
MTVRRFAALASLVVVLLGVWYALETPPAVPETRPIVGAVTAIGITVSDMNRSLPFYRDVLSFEPVSDVETRGDAYGIAGAHRRVVRMRLGEETIELVQWLTSAGRRMPRDSRSNDRWFQHIAIVVNDMDQAHLWLTRHKVEPISPEPQRLPDWNPGAGGIRAFYFKDPDGHPLELLQFPPDKGDARWRRPAERVFLGIDHTAIVVGDTEAGLRFYRDALGLPVTGTGENWGPEQERLNNVADARLRITMLRAPAGPGIELLEYLTPRDGRPAPSDARPSDLAHWRIVLRGDVDRAAAKVKTAHPLVLGFARGFTVRDPDGHAVELVGR